MAVRSAHQKEGEKLLIPGLVSLGPSYWELNHLDHLKSDNSITDKKRSLTQQSGIVC